MKNEKYNIDKLKGNKSHRKMESKNLRSPLANYIGTDYNVDKFKVPQLNESLKTFIGSPLQRSVSMHNLSVNSTNVILNNKKTRLSTSKSR